MLHHAPVHGLKDISVKSILSNRDGKDGSCFRDNRERTSDVGCMGEHWKLDGCSQSPRYPTVNNVKPKVASPVAVQESQGLLSNG